MFIWKLEENRCKYAIIEIVDGNFKKIDLIDDMGAIFVYLFVAKLYKMSRSHISWCDLLTPGYLYLFTGDWSRKCLYCWCFNFTGTYKNGKERQRCSMGMQQSYLLKPGTTWNHPESDWNQLKPPRNQLKPPIKLLKPRMFCRLCLSEALPLIPNLYCMKNVHNFSGPYFLVFGLNTEIYGVNLRIKPEFGEKNTCLDTFHTLLVYGQI